MRKKSNPIAVSANLTNKMDMDIYIYIYIYIYIHIYTQRKVTATYIMCVT